MSDLGKLCRAIEARERLTRDLESVERRLAATLWYSWMKRRDLHQRAVSLRHKIEDRNSKISDETVRDLANTIGAILWDRAASDVVPKKNTYGPAARARFDEILDAAVELGQDYVVYEDGSTFPLSALPEVNRLLTREFMRSSALRVIDERAAIAASPELIHGYHRDYEGKQVLMVQHVASGLRGQFTLDGKGFGSVGSKPYVLPSIDPENPGPLWGWEQVVGLGIGRRIYEEAQRLEPGIRWHGGMFSEYSRPLRRRLHAADPHVWSGPCDWCEENLLKDDNIHHWSDAPRSWFSGHP